MACAVSPPGPAPNLPDLKLPEAWTARNPASVAPRSTPSTWEEEFNDPRVADIVERTLKRNPTIAMAVANTERALAFASGARAERRPNLQGQARSEERQQRFIGFPLELGPDTLDARFTAHTVQLGWNWELDIWGRLKAGARAALAQAQAAQAELQAAALSLTGTALKAWFATIEAELQIQLARESLATRSESLEILTRRYRSGVASAAELEMAKSALALAEAQVNERATAARDHQRTLQELTGDYPDGASNHQGALPDPPSPIANGVPSEILRNRPDIRAAERRLAAADQSIWEARAALFPRLALTGSAGLTSSDLNELLDMDASIWSVAGAVSAPFLNHGRLKTLIDAANAESRLRVSEYLADAYQALREVEASLDLNGALIERRTLTNDALSSSRSALSHARRRYEAGLTDRLSVLEAKRSWIAHQEAALRIDRRLLDNRVNLRLALGGYDNAGSTGNSKSDNPGFLPSASRSTKP